MGWTPIGTATSTFVYCTHCQQYTPFPHACTTDPNKEILERLQRVENYLLELLSKARSAPPTLPSDSSS